MTRRTKPSLRSTSPTARSQGTEERLRVCVTLEWKPSNPGDMACCHFEVSFEHAVGVLAHWLQKDPTTRATIEVVGSEHRHGLA